MAWHKVCAVFILFSVCQAELYCKRDDCGEATSTYKEPYEAQSVVEESPYMISSEDLFYNFVAKHRPFVMRKTASNWPASKRWSEAYLIQSFSEDSHVSVTKGIQNYPFGPKHHLTIKEFFVRSAQEDLTLCNKPTTQMLNDITAPLCLRCQQFMKSMKVFYWLRHYHSEASTSLFFHPNEQLFTVVNGSVKVTLVSPLYSEKLPFNDEILLAIPSFNTDVLSPEGIPHLTVKLHKGDMLYIPQLWWQHITLPAGNNQFVQFLWPSKLETKSYLKSTTETKDHQFSSIQASLRMLIKKYEEQFLSMVVPRLDCPRQDKRMSDYTFETGKMTPEEYQAVHNGPDFTEDEPCNFDAKNQQSPCYFETCLEDPEAPVCIRYILEYCSQWEDRGCSIELPQLLNKVDRNTMEQITNMKSPYLY